MIGLIQNELVKIWEKKSSWIFAVILVLILIGGSIIEMKLSPQDKGDDWRASVQSEISKLEEKLPTAQTEESLFNSGKDYEWEDTKDYIEMTIQNYQHNLDENVSPYTTSWSNMNSMVFPLTSLITLFVVIICAGNVSSEFSDGTIKQLLIRPHRRWKILLSKYISLLVYSAALLVLLIIAGYLISIAFFGVGDFSNKVFVFGMEGEIAKNGGIYFFRSILYYIPGFILILTLAFMLSTLFKNQAIAVGIGIFVLFVSTTLGGLIQMFAESYSWAKVLVFPHLDQTVFLTQDKILETITMPMSLGILFIYYCIFMAITFFFFQKKDVSI